MPYNTKKSKRDALGNKILQVFNSKKDDYEPLEGSDGFVHSKVKKANFLPALGINVPVVVTAGSNITTLLFETAGYEKVFIRLQGNSTNWKISQRIAFNKEDNPLYASTQSSMLAPTSFTNNSNGSVGFLAVNSPFMKVEIANIGTSDALLNSLEIWVQ